MPDSRNDERLVVGLGEEGDGEEGGRGKGLRVVHHHRHHYRLRFTIQVCNSIKTSGATVIPSGAGRKVASVSRGAIRSGNSSSSVWRTW